MGWRQTAPLLFDYLENGNLNTFVVLEDEWNEIDRDGLAVIEEDNLRDLTNAKKHYEQLINQFPGSLYILEARKRFRNLRGDVL